MNFGAFLVGVSGFEPEASWTRTKRDTKLRHTPSVVLLYVLFGVLSSEKTAFLCAILSHILQAKGGHYMAERRNNRKGKRIMHRHDARRRGGRRASDAGTKKEPAVSKQRTSGLWQLAVSAAVLVAVIAWKLLAPQSFAGFRGQLTGLIGGDQDFAAVFSAVGRVADGEGELREVLNDAYVAVFGTEEIQNAETPSDAPDDLPDDVMLQQTVLGFAYRNPVEGTVSGRFGLRTHPVDGEEAFHYGLDIAADEGAVISSFADGKVTAVGESSTLGKYVVIAHAGDFQTLYAHCSRVTASSGQQVRMGDPIAEVGQTGNATGPHLHFELQHNTVCLNPIYYVSYP